MTKLHTHLTDITVPAGMVIVSQDEFFAGIAATPNDPMPSQSDPYHTSWETRSRQVVGRSYPGWKNSGMPGGKTYMLVESIAKRVKASA